MNGALIVLFVISFIIYCIAYELKADGDFLGKLASLTIFAHLWQFLMGTFLYIHFEKVKDILMGRSIVWLLIYLLSFVLYKNAPYGLESLLLLVSRVLMAFFIISFAFSYVEILERQTRRLGGDYSYGTYLYHALFINIFVEYGYNNGLLAIGALLILTYTCAYLSWRFIEYPALKLKRVFMRATYK
jgi:peptidoglycan/LPS O-acetylase OafA/YrhL